MFEDSECRVGDRFTQDSALSLNQVCQLDRGRRAIGGTERVHAVRSQRSSCWTRLALQTFIVTLQFSELTARPA